MNDTLLSGAVLEPILPDEAQALAAALVAERTLVGYAHAVLQCHDGLIWAVRDDVRRWVFASEADPDHVRPPRLVALQEIRLFGPDAEALVWRTDSGFAGRFLKDTPEAADAQVAPLERFARFEGRAERTAHPAFVRRRSGSGRVTVTPLGGGVRVKEYLEQCPQTGVLRIAATRFVEVFP